MPYLPLSLIHKYIDAIKVLKLGVTDSLTVQKLRNLIEINLAHSVIFSIGVKDRNIVFLCSSS